MTLTRRILQQGRLLPALALVLGAGIEPALADDADVQRLEARVAELESMVRQLVSSQAQQPPPVTRDPDPPPMSASGSSEYKFGGYIKADAMFSNYGSGDLAPGSAGTQFYIPGTIPVGDGSSQGPDADFQARESRIFFRSDHKTAGGSAVTTYLEMDFFLGSGGDERVSNSYNPRMRHAFIKYDDWLFGQTWSTFQDVTALPENLDFVGPAESTTFVRQTQARYTNGAWEFALENPETTITPFMGGGRMVTDDGWLPDIAARYTAKLDNGHIKVAGLVRQLEFDDGDNDDTEAGYALSVSGKHMVGRDDFRWMATAGSGVGRYLGLNTANGAVFDADGDLEAIDQYGAFASYRHFWGASSWRSNLTFGYLSIDNDTDLTGGGATKNAYSVHANLLFEPIPKMTIGGEVLYAKREIENGDDGDMTRFIFSAKYGF